MYICQYNYFRVAKDPKLSVTDASAVWYLQVLAATATASIPASPYLRTAIVQHTKYDIQYNFFIIYQVMKDNEGSFIQPVVHMLFSFVSLLINIL